MKTSHKQPLPAYLKYLAPILGGILLITFAEPISAAQILLFAIFGIGYDLLLGYSGILSFGHAAFIGIGAYVTALCITYLWKSLALGMLGGIVLAGIAAWPIGILSLRRRGLYFAMITLGFAQVLYFLAFKWRSMTGGSDGMPVVRPNITLGWVTLDLQGKFIFNVVVLLFFILMLILSFRIIDSPFGKVLQAIRENEDRARAIGYDVDRYLLRSFVISALFGGVAGSLYTLLFRFVSPDILFWTISGQVVLMTVMGGVGTVYGPIIGSIIFIFLQDFLSKYTSHWPLIFGFIFVFVVVFAPKGIVGAIRDKLSSNY